MCMGTDSRTIDIAYFYHYTMVERDALFPIHTADTDATQLPS